jgi:uncharacterized protein
MDRAAFNRSILDDTAHRPWPMPDGSWVMTQSWHDLLFAHWPVDAEALRAPVPAIFELDRFDGATWLGIVPFYMTNVTPWPLESAEAEIAVNTMADAAGLRLPVMAPLLHFSKRQDMVCWPPERLTL